MDSISSLLTDEIVRSAPTKKKPYTIRDGRGLFVLIHPNGSRYFQLRATIEGKRKLMQLGVYPQVSIEEARALAVARLESEMGEAPLTQGEFFNMREDNAIVTAPLIDVPVDMPEQEAKETQQVKVISFTEEEVIAMQGAENKRSAPRVSLQYSQLVYVPKTLPKTFSQKLAERAHPNVLWTKLLVKLTNIFDGLKQSLLSGIDQVRANLIERISQLTDSLRKILRTSKAGLLSWLGGIKNNGGEFALKLSQKYSTFKMPDLGARWRALWRKSESSGVAEVEVVTTSSHLSEMEEVPLPASVPLLDALVLPATQASSGSNGALDRLISLPSNLKRLFQNEALADRADVVSVYGLFSESKGNYLIYTIKSIAASVLAKKG